MKSPALKFVAAVVVISAICAVLQLLWNSQMPNMKLNNGFLLLGIFAATVTAIHLFLLNSTKGSPQAFIRGFMASTVLKFFLYLLVLIAFLLYSTENKRTLVLHFLFYYVVFTALEVTMLYRELSKMNQKKA